MSSLTPRPRETEYGSSVLALAFHFQDPDSPHPGYLDFGDPAVVIRASYSYKNLNEIVDAIPDISGYFGEIRTSVFEHGASAWATAAIFHFSVDDVLGVLRSLIGGLAARAIYDKYLKGLLDKKQQSSVAETLKSFQECFPELPEMRVTEVVERTDYVRIHLASDNESVVIEVLGDSKTLKRYKVKEKS